MGRPKIRVPSLPSGAAGAGRIRELMGLPSNPAAPPPPAPTPRSAQTQAPKPKTPHDERVEEFLAKSGNLPPPEPGATRLYRVGERATDYQTPKTIKQWGQEIPYEEWRAQIEKAQGPAGPNPRGAAGRWATDAAHELDYYIQDNPVDAPVYYFDVPDHGQYNVANTPYLKNSRNPEREFVLPDSQLSIGKRLMALAPLLMAGYEDEK